MHKIKRITMLGETFSVSTNTETEAVSVPTLHRSAVILMGQSENPLFFVSATDVHRVLHRLLPLHEVSSGILEMGGEDSEAAVHHAAVLRLQTVGNALLHLLTTAQEPAAVPRQLLPGAPAILLLLIAAGKELLYTVTETNLTGSGESRCSQCYC